MGISMQTRVGTKLWALGPLLLALCAGHAHAAHPAGSCSIVAADRRVVTFDGLQYNPALAGTFALVESKPLTVQVTTAQLTNPPVNSPSYTAAKSLVAVKAVAFRFGTAVYTIEGGRLSKPHAETGVTVMGVTGRWTFKLSDGSSVQVTAGQPLFSDGSQSLAVRVVMPEGAMSTLRGLCGNFDDNRANDTTSPGGSIIELPRGPIMLQDPKNPRPAPAPDGSSFTKTWTVFNSLFGTAQSFQSLK